MSFKQFLSESSINDIDVIDSSKSNGEHPEASYRTKNGKPQIELYPKYYKLSKPEKLHVIYHELGHWFRNQFISLGEIMGWDEGENFFIYSMGNSEEGFAEAFANFFDDPKDLKKKYPEQYERLDKYIGSMKNTITKKAKELVK